jgi:hypothetical protein
MQDCHWEVPPAGMTGKKQMHVCLNDINIRSKLLLQLLTDQYSRSVRDKTATHLAPPPSAHTITAGNPEDQSWLGPWRLLTL